MRRGRESHAVHLATWDSHLARINGYTRALRLTSKLDALCAEYANLIPRQSLGAGRLRAEPKRPLPIEGREGVGQEFAPSYELPTGKDGAMIRT